MRRRVLVLAITAVALVAGAPSHAGMIILRSAPVFRPSFSVPTFRAPVFRAPAFRPNYGFRSGGIRPFRIGPSVSGPRVLGRRSNPYEPGTAWGGFAPQIRNRPGFKDRAGQQMLPLQNARSAETDLLNKLRVPPPGVHSFGGASPVQNTAIANQAENKLLTDLHANTLLSTSMKPPQQISTAKAAEDTLLKSLETPSQVHSLTVSAPITVSAPTESAIATNAASSKPATPAPEQSSTVVTIINPNGTHVINPNAPSVVTTVIPGDKADTTAVSPTYTFTTTPYGTVQISQGGKIVATTTPETAAVDYGYHLPKAAIQAPTTVPVAIAEPATAAKPVTVGTASQNSQTAPTQQATLASSKTTTTPLASANPNRSSSTQTPTSAGSFGSTTELSLSPTLKNTVSLSSTGPTIQTPGASGSNPTQSYNTGVTGFGQSTLNSNTGQSVNVATFTQSLQGGNNPSYGGSLVQETIHSGSASASISVGNINSGLSVTAGPTPTLGANVSASVVQEQLTNSATGITVSGSAFSAQAGATASIGANSPESTISLGAGAYVAQLGVQDKIPVGNFNVNLGADGGVGLGLGGSVSLGANGAGASGDLGPVGLNFSITPN